MDIHDVLRKKLKLKEGIDSTPDMLFTVETVNCLGACGLAPAMVINDEVYGQLTPERANKSIDEIILKEVQNESDPHGA
jgi:NADH-quinone oxidoreductase subunit E